MTKPDIEVRPLDQTGNIRHCRAAETGEIHHTNHGVQSGERIRRNLGMGRGKHSQQSRFSRVRVADQPRVSDHAQLEEKPTLLSRRALGVLTRSTVA